MALRQLIEQIWQQLHRATMLNPLLFTFLIVSFLFVCFNKFTRGAQLNLPPSPPKFPIIGNIHQLGSLPHRTLRTLSNKYGPLMLLQLGQTPTLVISSAETVKEMTKNHDILFSNRPKITAANIFLYQCADLGFAPYGEYWRKAKKICVLELLSHKRVQSFQFVRKEETADMVDKIRRAFVKGTSVNLSEMLMGISNNIVSRCVLGRKVEEEIGKSKFGELARRFMVLFAAFSVGDVFPSLAWVDHLTGLIARQKVVFREIDALLDQIIEEHRTTEIDNESQRIDFVHILLQLQRDGTLDINLTQDNIKGLLLDMFMAGTESSATLMEWTMAELVRNPSVLSKVQEEVRTVVGGKSKIDANDISHMCYLKCIIKESLRIHPPGPLAVPRETTAGVKLGGYDIPPKTRVLVNIWAIQRDPELWDKPEEFIPERFHNNPVDVKGQDFQLIPFGAGRRSCPGISFSLASAEYILANLLYWFDWKLPGVATTEDVDMSEAFGQTVTKKFPLHLVPTLCSP